MNDLNGLRYYLDSISKNNVKIEFVEDSSRDGYRIYATSVVDLSRMELYRNQVGAVREKMQALRDNILNSDLFYSERKELQEYEKLKNMKFVLDALKELDLSSIKEVHEKPTYFNSLQALKSGVKNG